MTPCLQPGSPPLAASQLSYMDLMPVRKESCYEHGLPRVHLLAG